MPTNINCVWFQNPEGICSHSLARGFFGLKGKCIHIKRPTEDPRVHCECTVQQAINPVASDDRLLAPPGVVRYESDKPHPPENQVSNTLDTTKPKKSKRADERSSVMWNTLKDQKRTKRQQNTVDSVDLLKKSGISYERAGKDGDAHLIVKCGKVLVDFWPSTGRWVPRDEAKTEFRGVRNLIAYHAFQRKRM